MIARFFKFVFLKVSSCIFVFACCMTLVGDGSSRSALLNLYFLSIFCISVFAFCMTLVGSGLGDCLFFFNLYF